jgi:hypothetical protein
MVNLEEDWGQGIKNRWGGPIACIYVSFRSTTILAILGGIILVIFLNIIIFKENAETKYWRQREIQGTEELVK